MSTSGGYHEYIGGCSVHRGDTMMNVGGYHEYIGGCSVHRRDTMSTSGGYHEYIGGCSVHLQFLHDVESIPAAECDCLHFRVTVRIRRQSHF